MAQPVPTHPNLARIWINATAPGVPGAAKLLCAISSKALNQTINTAETIIPDCADPLKVSTVIRTPVSKDWNITGTGLMELVDRAALQDLIDGIIPTDLVYEYKDPAYPDGYYHGLAFLTQYNQIANIGDGYCTVDLVFSAAGELDAFVENATTPPPSP